MNENNIKIKTEELSRFIKNNLEESYKNNEIDANDSSAILLNLSANLIYNNLICLKVGMEKQ